MIGHTNRPKFEDHYGSDSVPCKQGDHLETVGSSSSVKFKTAGPSGVLGSAIVCSIVFTLAFGMTQTNIDPHPP